MRRLGTALWIVCAALLAGCGAEEPPVSAEALQGDWVMVPTPAADGNVYVYMSETVFSFRGDSALHVGWLGTSWHPFRLSGDTLEIGGRDGPEQYPASLVGDTLVIGARDDRTNPFRFRRLRANASVPRPERIALSGIGCFGVCPAFDMEIDSTGTIRYFREARVRWPGEEEEPDEREWRPIDPEGAEAYPRGSYVGTGYRALFGRLSEMAAGLRADSTHELQSDHDAYDLRLAVWYDGELRVHGATDSGFGELRLLISELMRTAREAPLQPTDERYRFVVRERYEQNL